MTEQISKQEIKKIYFGDRDPKADERIIEQGWTYAQDKFINEDNHELDALGYKVIESNIGRTIFVKSKVQMH